MLGIRRRTRRSRGASPRARQSCTTSRRGYHVTAFHRGAERELPAYELHALPTPTTHDHAQSASRLREIRLPLREPFRISSGVISDRRILLLELTDASGVTTWSECVAGEIA